MKESIQLVQDNNDHVVNEKAFRKENVEKLLSNLRCNRCSNKYFKS